jgi:hypothetical protein
MDVPSLVMEEAVVVRVYYIDGIEGSTAARLEAYDYGSMTGLDLVLKLLQAAT